MWSDHRPPGRIVATEADDPALLIEVLETPEGQEVVLRAPEAYVKPKGVLCVTLHTNDEEAPRLRICVLRGRTRSLWQEWVGNSFLGELLKGEH